MKHFVYLGVARVALRPKLWGTAVSQLWRLRRTGWYKQFPFLPIPTSFYLQFRLLTAYGSDTPGDYEASDLVTYLEWCRGWSAASR